MARKRTLGGRLAWIAAMLLALVALALAVRSYARHWRPSVHDYPLQGLDVSEAQGDVDWWAVRGDGANFAYVRATAGAGTRDARFAANWAAVPATGMRRGAMHVWSLCARASDQANNFNTTVPREDDALPAAVVLDFQPGCAARPAPALVLDQLRTFMTLVELHTGKPMLMKLSKAFDDAYHVSAAIPRPVWAARDYLSPGYAAQPWRMWQANDHRLVDGVAGPVNWDVVAP